MQPARKPAADLHTNGGRHDERRRDRPPIRRPIAGGNPGSLRRDSARVDGRRREAPARLDAQPLDAAGVPDFDRATLAADVRTIADHLAARAARCAVRSRSTWPLADWTHAELELDDRILAGDPAGLRDAVAEALIALTAAAAAIDATLARWTGPLRHPVATPARLDELAARAAAGFDLFPTTGAARC